MNGILMRMYCLKVIPAKKALTLRKEANGADMPLLDFYEKMLDKDATQYFYDLLDKYDIKPLSLSPSVLETSIRLIDEEFNHR